jgi:hypothetical protein
MSRLGWFVFQIVVISAVWYACYQGAAEKGFEGTSEGRAISYSLLIGIAVAYGLTFLLVWLFDLFPRRLFGQKQAGEDASAITTAPRELLDAPDPIGGRQYLG